MKLGKPMSYRVSALFLLAGIFCTAHSGHSQASERRHGFPLSALLNIPPISKILTM